MNHIKFFFLLSLVFIPTIFGLIGPDHLPYASGPGPLFSFGQNVQQKNGFVYRQIYAYTETDFHSILLIHNHFYYGITDYLTFVLKQPIIAKNFQTGVNGRGLGNTRIELEGIPYMYHIPDEFRFRTTLIGGLIFPTNTSQIISLQTTKSMNYFAGVTESIATRNIFQYMFFGIFIPTSKHGNNFGFLFYYQTGFAHRIIMRDDFYLGADLEISGQYQKSQKVAGVTDYTTGGNTIFIGPSLRCSRDHFILQLGIQYPWVKHNKRPQLDPTNFRSAFAAAMRF